MAGYTRTVRDTFDFDGDKVTVIFRRLKRHELMQLQPFIQETKGGEIEMEFESQNAYFGIVEELLPDVIKELSGLTIDDEKYAYHHKEGDKEELTELLTEAYFIPLTQQILGSVIVASVPKKGEEKKSGSTSKESSKA